MKKKLKSFICFGIIIFSCVCISIFKLGIRRKVSHHLVKRHNNEMLPPDAYHDNIAFEAIELLPGQLICEVPPAPRPTQEAVLPLESLSNTENPIINEPKRIDKFEAIGSLEAEKDDRNSAPEKAIVGESVKTKQTDEAPIPGPPVEVPPQKLALVDAWRVPSRKIGCCPAGDRNGKAFTEGMACCVDQIYNGTTEFCCLSKRRKMARTEENLSFCYPPNQVPFCRVSDLRLGTLQPMEIACTHTGGRNKNPSECTFVCPPGSQVRGHKKVTCSSVGNWEEADPQCCEGCPTAFELDIWFVVDIDERIGAANLSSIRNFIKFLVGYFPIGQSKVRVAVTAYNGVIFTNQNTWYLNKYNSTEGLNRAIDRLPREGSGRQTGNALKWLAENAFNEKKGDRSKVENVIVLITTGEPDDHSLLEGGSKILRGHSKLIAIAVGPEATSPALKEIVSPPRKQNYLRIPSFENLDLEVKYLYDLLCEEHCLGASPNYFE